MTFQAGELDQRVMFKREVRNPDGYGGSTLEWETVATVWAKVRPMSGKERTAAERVNAESNYLIVIRARSDLDETMIAVWNGAEFNIRFVKSRPRSGWLEIEAEKGVAK